MLLWLNISLFCSVCLIIFLLTTRLGRGKEEVQQRLQSLQNLGDTAYDDDILKKPVYERLIGPTLHEASRRLTSLAPKELLVSIEQKLTYGGNPWHITVSTFIMVDIFFAITLLLLAFIFTKVILGASASGFLLYFLLALIGMLLPYSMISSAARKRQKEIQKSIPDMLDLLLVSVEAGLGFDMALKKVADKMPGALSVEINRTLDEIRMGKTRNEALRGMVKRTGVMDLNSFVTAVVQAEQLGSNIANTLGILAEQMRQKRRQRAEEQAMKAPVKILFPLIFFIFPALFVVLLGPAVLKIIQTFLTMF